MIKGIGMFSSRIVIEHEMQWEITFFSILAGFNQKTSYSMIRNYLLSFSILLMIGIGAKAQISFSQSSSFNYLKGKEATNLPTNWMNGNYNPTTWSSGKAPFWYGDGTGGTIISDMQNSYSTIYLRSKFTAKNISELTDVLFSINYDDGFIIWINGEEVLSVNAPENPANNSFSLDQHESGTFESFTLPAHDLELKEGENLIAIQGFNVTLESSDFHFDMQMSADFKQPQTTDTLKVLFSKPGGFYTSSFNLKLDVPDQSYSILYTIDGSNPQTSSTAQSGGKSKTLTINPSSTSGRPKTPCYIVRAALKKEGTDPTFPLTQTYIFIDQVIDQSNPGGGWPSGNSTINGQTIDLEMDPDVTNSFEYSGLMKSALNDIPSISVVTNLKDLFDQSTGIYVNALSHGERWERECSVELLNPSGAKGFNINAGLRIRGGWSRHGNYPKHGFRLFFREEYGAPKLIFPLFEDEGTDEFDKIDLRCEQNYSWANGDYRNTCVREVFSRDTQRDMGQPYTRSRYYHLYLNGMYWGLFQTQERSEARYAADYFGGKVEDYDVIKVNSEVYQVEATDGNRDSWQKIYNLCNKGFASNSDYFSLEGKDGNGYPKKGGEIMVDIDNMIDYLLGIFYTGNFDAPTSSFSNPPNNGVNNFYAIDKRDDKSKGFVFFNHDGEHCMMIDPASPGIGLYEDRVNLNMSVSGINYFHPQWLHHKLTSNNEYRLRVADRVYKSFFNNGVFVPEVAQERFQKRVDENELAIIGESARWGDAQSWTPYTQETWQDEIDDIYNRFFPYRTDIVLDQLMEAGLYPYFDPPIMRKDNVVLDREVYSVSGNSKVTLSSPKGSIFYTLDGTDPRMIGGMINTSAHELESGGTIDFNGSAIINSRVQYGEEWSALHSVKFINSNEDFTNLKVTEINYHPTDSIIGTDTVSGKSFEFIELKNTGSNSMNLTGLKFTSSIQYQFKVNEVLPPKQFYVVASKPKWFYERYSMVPSGSFDNNFSNSGEQVIIAASNGNEIINFQYFDIDPWATGPDGGGFTLSSVMRNPTGNPNDYSYWKASSVYNGSPFADDPGIADSKEELQLTGNSIVLYPNPTKGILYLKVDAVISDGSIEVYTLSGTRIFESVINGNSMIDLNMLNINPGIYLIKIQFAGRNSVHKVIYQP
jgi:hypothetical protein